MNIEKKYEKNIYILDIYESRSSKILLYTHLLIRMSKFNWSFMKNEKFVELVRLINLQYFSG
jgi:hypothetical protein